MEKLLEGYFDRLWPICRSITGNGLRESFRILQEIIPLELEEVATGTQVFDWEIPKEWNIRDAHIITPDGDKICDFRQNNLHVLNYSVSQNRVMDLDELRPHLFSREDLPHAVPYVTSYYKENWGFGIAHEQLSKLPKNGNYQVYIDSELKDGHLTYGHLILPGETNEEILFSSYLCHPSMANNELSGPLVMAALYKKIKALPSRKYTYRFVLAPETIGIIAYLARYGKELTKNTKAGYVLTCVGTWADPIYKRSKQGNSLADMMAERILKRSGLKFRIIPFAVGGSDERQYCSPGFNLPVGSLIRSMYQTYPEYHTSLDNKDLISFEAMEKTSELYFEIVKELEQRKVYTRTDPFCEPRLGKRNLYPQTGGTWQVDLRFTHMVLHTLAFSDGNTDLQEIAGRFGATTDEIQTVAEHLVKVGLLKEI